MRMHRDGFTIIETMFAIGLLGIMIGLSLPFYLGYLADRSLQNAAHLVQSDLRLAQQAAAARAGSGPRVEMCFRPDGYEIYPVDYEGSLLDRTGAQVGQTLRVANAGQEYRSGIAATVPASASDQCLIDPGRQAIVFSASGAPISFDDISAKDIALTFSGRAYRVTIAPVTGRVTVGR